MKYVDEFRDRDKATRAGRARSTALVAAPSRSRPAAADHGGVRRPHALDLPLRHRGHAARSRSSWCMARAVRSACCRWAASTTASRIAEQPGVIFTTFGDAMRVPGSKQSLLQAKAERRRRPHGVFADRTRWRSRARTRTARWCSSVSASRPRCRRTALTVLQAERDGIGNFSRVLQPHHDRADDQGDPRQSRPADRRLPRARPRVDGDRHRALRFIARHYRKPLVVAGFEPLDVLQSIWMVLRQIADGRAEVENQYARVVAGRRQRARRCARSHGSTSCASSSNGAAWARSTIPASGSATPMRGSTPSAGSRCPACRSPIRKSCQCGEVLKGVIKPHAVQGVRHRLHAGDAARRADGVVRRRVRRVLPYRRQAAGCADARARATRRARSTTLAHGGGGKAMKDLIDDVFVAAFDNPLLAPLDDQARVPMSLLAEHGDRLAITTDSFVVDPLDFPGGDIGKLAVCGTVNDLAVGGATPLYLSCAAIIEEGLPFDLLHRIARSMAAAAREAGVQVVTGDTKVVPARRLRQTVPHHDRHRRDPRRARAWRASRAARRRRAGQRRARRPWRGDPGGARRPGAGRADRQRLRRAARTGRCVAGRRARRRASCATRRAAVSPRC